MAIVTTAVFLVQLLCLLVPCDPQFPLPEVSPHRVIYESDKLSPRTNNLLTTATQRENEVFGEKRRTSPGFSLDHNGYEVPPIFHTKCGSVEGYYQTVVGGRKIAAFNLPYAEAPLGNLRFRDPVPRRPWEGVFSMKKLKPCLQYNIPRGFRVVGKEDCLHMTIYTPYLSQPNAISGRKLPVVVFIHGGGFFLGGSRDHGPSYLLQHDVILCVPQYRLGIMGFMSTGDAVSPGNWGLKDQLLALQWISENIFSFGGDASQVTIIGQSAGSAMVHFHMLSRRSRPFFSKAVSMSGTALNYWAIYTPPQCRNLTNRLAEFVKCPIDDSYELVHCLRNTNPILLVSQTKKFVDDWPYPSNAFRPCIEVIDGNKNAFLTDHPLNLYAKKDVAHVPWIVTMTSGEGYVFLMFPFVTFLIPQLQKHWTELAPDLADVEDYPFYDKHHLTKELTRFYLRNMHPKNASIHQFARIVTDRMFVLGIYKAAQLHSQISPTFSYIFDVNSQYNLITSLGYSNYEWGVGHSEDLWFVFNGSTTYSGFRQEDPEFEISQFMVNIFSNFIKFGEPKFTNEYGNDEYVWSPHSGPLNLDFLKIDFKKANMIGDPFKRIIEFWDNLHIPDTPTQQQILNLNYETF